MSKRPPFLGYNHNVRHAGHLFHVQTEDSGLGRLVLFTHCFVDGTILASLRGTYTAEESDAAVQKRMQDQHKAMLRRVRDGEFDNHPEVVGRAGQAGAHDKPTAAKPEAPTAAAKPEAKADAKVDAKPEVKVDAKVEAKPEAKPAVMGAKSDGKPDAGALAARLLQKTPAQAVPATLPTATNTAPIAAAKPVPNAPTIDLDTDSDEDLMIDIVADSATDDEDEAFELSKATPLPAAKPLVGGDSAEHAPVHPPSPNPLFQVTVGRISQRTARLTRPVYVRGLHTGRLRMHSTSEGAVMLTPAALKVASGSSAGRPPGESLRKTQFHARPTIPGAVSAIGLGTPAGEQAPLDDLVLAFLRREAARPL